MAPLLSGLDELPIVRTPVFTQLRDLGDFVVPRAEILVVDGDIGVGKTVLVDAFIASQTVPSTVVSLPPRQSSRDIARALHAAVSDGDETHGLTERDLQDELVRALAEPRIVVVRDAHRLSAEGAGQLEWLHSHPSTGWTLILEGGPGTAAAVEREAMLRGRVASTLTVPILSGSALLDVLQRLHTLFMAAEPELLMEIDARVCRGVFLHWARFLQVALHIADKAAAQGRERPVLDRMFAKAIIAALPKTVTKVRN